MKLSFGFLLGAAFGLIAGILSSDSDLGKEVREVAHDLRQRGKKAVCAARELADEGLHLAHHAAKAGRSVLQLPTLSFYPGQAG